MVIKLSQTNTIASQSFHNAWTAAIEFVLTHGTELIFGTPGEGKKAKDSCQKIILRGDAIGQIERHETHPQYKFGGKRLEEYCKEFTSEFLSEYNNKTKESERFDYLYYERLKQYRGLSDFEQNGTLNQLEAMSDLLKSQMDSKTASNFNQAITWEAERDGMYNTSSPCLQRIWLRWYEQNIVDVHLSWRSRDLFGAWQSNLVAIVEMLNREVIKPNRCQIARIIDDNDSLHIYDYDLNEARRVERVPTFHGVR
jgi:thymidylate synthase